MATVHIGFKAAAAKAAKGSGVSMERGRAIIAAAARKASPAAKKANPRLMRVRGAAKRIVGQRMKMKKY